MLYNLNYRIATQNQAHRRVDDFDDESNVEFLEMCDKGNDQELKKLFQTQPNIDWVSGLKLACQNHHLICFQTLVKHHSALRIPGYRFACQYGCVPIMEWLQSIGPVQYHEGFKFACQGGQIDIARALCTQHGFSSHVYFKASFLAGQNGNRDLIQMLIDCQPHNYMPLQILLGACSGGHLDIVQWIMPRSKIESWSGMLYFAAEKNHFHVVDYLIGKGANFRDLTMFSSWHRILANVLNYNPRGSTYNLMKTQVSSFYLFKQRQIKQKLICHVITKHIHQQISDSFDFVIAPFVSFA